jgi:hypothetical protein
VAGDLRGLHLEEGVEGEQRGLRRREVAVVVPRGRRLLEEVEGEERQLGLQKVGVVEGGCQREELEKKKLLQRLRVKQLLAEGEGEER